MQAGEPAAVAPHRLARGTYVARRHRAPCGRGSACYGARPRHCGRHGRHTPRRAARPPQPDEGRPLSPPLPLSALDALFLHAETAATPMHVGSLHRCRLPAGYRGDWHAAVKAHLAGRLHLAPVFTRRLAAVPLNLANPVWVEADAVDLDAHVRRVVLPAPGSRRQLEALVAQLHATPLDRARPLWQFHVIEGLADGSVGFYTKVHHAAVDGQAGVALGRAMLDPTPVPRALPPPRATGAADPPGAAALLGAALTHALQQTRALGRLVRPLGTALTERARAALTPAERGERGQASGAGGSIEASGWGGLRALITPPPPSPFNASITNERSFATVALPLAPIKALGRTHGASVNDSVLWLCSTALREYLQAAHALPAASLVAGVPVSLRASGDDAMRNQVTMSLITLGSQLADPHARLAAIRASTARLKTGLHAFGALIPTDLPALGAPWLLGALVALWSRSGIADRARVVNLTISNVPGAPVPLYLAGAQLLDYYPVSIVIHGVALNITVHSYLDQLCFGLIACRRAVPDLPLLAAALERAFDAYQQLAPLGSPPPAARGEPTSPPRPPKSKTRQAATPPRKRAPPPKAARGPVPKPPTESRSVAAPRPAPELACKPAPGPKAKQRAQPTAGPTCRSTRESAPSARSMPGSKPSAKSSSKPAADVPARTRAAGRQH